MRPFAPKTAEDCTPVAQCDPPAPPDGTPRRGAAAGPIAVLTIIYCAGYLVFERAGLGSDQTRELVGNLAFMPLNLVVVVLNGLASRNPVLHPGVRRALGVLALGSLAVFLGNIISLYLAVRGDSPPVSWADGLYLTDSLLILAALFCFPLGRRTQLENWKFVLDAAMVLLGGSVLIWYFVVRPTTAHGDDFVVNLLAFAYPLVSLLVLLGITTVMLRSPLDGNREAFWLVVAGILASVVADLVFDLVLLETGVRSAAWTDAVYLLSYILMIASAELYWRHPVPYAERSEDEQLRSHPISPLPYVAVGCTYALLLYVAFSPWREPMSNVAVGAVLITFLVVARQLLAVQENVRLLAETAARQNEARFRSLVQHSSDVIVVITKDARVHYVSPSVARVLRWEATALTGIELAELVHPDDRRYARAFFRTAAEVPGVSTPAELRFTQPDGSWLHAEVIATNLLEDPTVRGIVLNTRDVSERKRLERELTHQAFHDPLTGLANRALFRDRVSHALTLAYRQGHSISVLFLDLDDFKKVNDSLGHSVGDRLLIAAAERFRSCARAADTIARLGGDEFAILIENIDGGDQSARLLERLSEAMLQPFVLGGNEVQLSTSIGIATSSGDESADDLLRNADVAMYTAKRDGKGRFETYRSQMYADIRQRLELEAALRAAIEREEFTLHYQPILCLKSGAVRGVEALIRWDHPRHGHVLPQHFIPLAEETGLIVPMGTWILRESLRQVQQWRLAHPSLDLSVAVNISSRQLLGPDIVTEARVAIEQTGIDPAAVVLEITESVLMQQTGAVLERLQELKGIGVQLAIDDFGTGYSSLSYLQRFPIDILKIAKPFVDDVGRGSAGSSLAQAIVGLGDTLNLRTIAEGIEQAEQRSALLQLGCELGQGYYFAAPLPAGAIEQLLPGPIDIGVVPAAVA